MAKFNGRYTPEERLELVQRHPNLRKFDTKCFCGVECVNRKGLKIHKSEAHRI
jgi:hypothetical protein